MDLNNAKIMVALISAAALIVSALVALISALAVNLILKRTKERELFQSALQHLTGRTQNRSVGIAIIEKYANEYAREDVASKIFVAQMLHLHDRGYGQGPEHWKSVRSTAGKIAKDDEKSRKSEGKSDTEEDRFRHIEEFNFLMMKTAVERWNKFPSNTPAADIAKPLNLNTRNDPAGARWRRALSQIGSKQRSLEL